MTSMVDIFNMVSFAAKATEIAMREKREFTVLALNNSRPIKKMRQLTGVLSATHQPLETTKEVEKMNRDGGMEHESRVDYQTLGHLALLQRISCALFRAT